MEHPLSSSLEKSPSSPEESSSWTACFECFSSNTSDGEHSACSSFGSSSWVSDSASAVAWRTSHSNGFAATRSCSTGGRSAGLPKRSASQKLKNFKQTRSRDTSSYGDSLEDTASSPVYSPKREVNLGKMDDNLNRYSQGNGGESGGYSEPQADLDEGNKINFEGKNNEYCPVLKKNKRPALGRFVHVSEPSWLIS
ncbi:uncharacterized protein LOC131146337 [Malania oleifera]|uniref:uncharacterized protein LOC131146337 n=1 Tax=Malania oleifera TaxID=397392 RepID=UPI0025AE3C43|nr:uncharacterized protein LOC131146337 [Malania oleifera]